MLDVLQRKLLLTEVFTAKIMKTIFIPSGVKRVSMPKRGKKSKARKELESAFWFKRLQRFRAGNEATISMLKRCRGLNRILSRGTSGSKSWIAMGIMAHNLWKLAQL
jgi:IS5 family transposase